MTDLPSWMKTGRLVRHYKGNTYRILHLARHTETGEELVIYVRSPAVSTEMELWARPKNNFLSTVETPDGPVPRFTPVEE